MDFLVTFEAIFRFRTMKNGVTKTLTKLRKIYNTGWNRETCKISEKTVKTSGNLSPADDIIRTLLGSFVNFSSHKKMKIEDTKKQTRSMKSSTFWKHSRKVGRAIYHCIKKYDNAMCLVLHQ
ncbi:uncharacterized protein LOC120338694 [Styela clava]